LSVALSAYIIFSIFDGISSFREINPLMFIRFFIGIPSLSIFLFITFTKIYERHYQKLLVAISLIMGAVMSYTSVITGNSSVHTYYAGLIILFMILYTFIGLRFSAATLCGWSIILLYEFFLLLSQMGDVHTIIQGVELRNNLLLIIANVIGMWTGYHMECLSRLSFKESNTYQHFLENKEIENKKLNADVKGLRNTLEIADHKLVHSKERLIAHETLANVGKLSSQIIKELKEPLRYAKTDLIILKDHFKTIQPLLISFSSQSSNDDKVNVVSEDCGVLLQSLTSHLNLVNSKLSDLYEFTEIDKDNYQHFDVNTSLLTTLNLTRNHIKPYAELKLLLCNEADIYGNHHTIHQVLYQIIQNATDAIKEKNAGIKGEIKVYTFNEDKHIRIEVKDNGIGIENQVLNNVFDPFFTTKKSVNGNSNGLGLSFAYDVVHRHHGGDIEISSQPGIGTTVSMLLPKIPRSYCDADDIRR
jgi:signal transduction histidine kinase